MDPFVEYFRCNHRMVAPADVQDDDPETLRLVCPDCYREVILHNGKPQEVINQGDTAATHCYSIR